MHAVLQPDRVPKLRHSAIEDVIRAWNNPDAGRSHYGREKRKFTDEEVKRHNAKCLRKLHKYLQPDRCACKQTLFPPPPYYYFEEEARFPPSHMMYTALNMALRDPVLVRFMLDFDAKHARPSIPMAIKLAAFSEAIRCQGELWISCAPCSRSVLMCLVSQSPV